MEFKASFDTLTKFISVAVIILFIAISVRSFHSLTFSQDRTMTIVLHSIILIFILTTVLVSYLFSIDKYLIDGNNFIIKRSIGNKIISLSDIEEVRLIEHGEMSGTVRTFGNAGLFGYYGKYYNNTFGSMTLYTTQRKNRIYIKTKSGEKIIISPDDLELVTKLKPGLSNSL